MAFTPAPMLALIDGNNFYVCCERVFQPWLQGPGHQVVRSLFQLRESSISSPIPGMPNGKPAGVPCVQLTYKCVAKILGP
jgi:hypothetical protein